MSDWNAIALREGITQSRDIDVAGLPDSLRVMKTVLVTFVRDPRTILVTQNRDLIGDPTEGNNFSPVNVDGRFDASVRLLDEKVVGRSNDRDCINASFAQISDDFEAISGIDRQSQIS